VSLPVLIDKHYGGDKEYYPLGVSLRPFQRSKVYRFCKPFKDFNHGKPKELELLSAEFIIEAHPVEEAEDVREGKQLMAGMPLE
jgi:hypothetical protein